MNSWLPLTEYSSKYHVSISTLRRRIKTDTIKYQFEDGRYLIFDQRPSLTSPPPGKKEVASAKTEAASLENKSAPVKSFAAEKPADRNFERSFGNAEEPILTAANRLLSELKKAYTQILQEKEEQILHLKEEVSDLKTLVRVLESENDRLRR